MPLLACVRTAHAWGCADERYLEFRPSSVAAGAILVAMHGLGDDGALLAAMAVLKKYADQVPAFSCPCTIRLLSCTGMTGMLLRTAETASMGSEEPRMHTLPQFSMS